MEKIDLKLSASFSGCVVGVVGPSGDEYNYAQI